MKKYKKSLEILLENESMNIIDKGKTNLLKGGDGESEKIDETSTPTLGDPTKNGVRPGIWVK